MATPTMEDYLERIYKLIKHKGYARVSDIAEELEVHPSSVTRMVQRLDEQKLVEYERYRGLILTTKGEELGRAVNVRHKALEEFLRIMGLEDADTIQLDTEGIEHHVSPDTLAIFLQLVSFFKEHPDVLERFRRFKGADELSRPIRS